MMLIPSVTAFIMSVGVDNNWFNKSLYRNIGDFKVI